MFYLTTPEEEIPKGSYVPPHINVIYKCKANYTLDGISKNYCINGKWSVPNHPKCIKFCSPMILLGITITSRCEINNEIISCRQPLRPNTIARITCATGYRKPTGTVFTDVLHCEDNGEWDFNALRCEQICGLEGRTIADHYL